MGDSGETGTNKILVTMAAIVAGAIAQRVVMLGWRVVRGSEPGDDDESSLTETLIFAAVTAAAVASARTWATRKARRDIRSGDAIASD